MRATLLLLIVSAALLASACGAQTATSTRTSPSAVAASTRTATHPRSRSRTSSAPATSTSAAHTTVTHTTSAPPAPLQVLRTFAVAYGAYLDGRVPATTLPDASASARSQVGSPIPAARRSGTLALVAVAQIGGGPSYIVSLRDRAHTFGAQLTLTATARGWVVSAVSPPDLDTILGPPARPIPPPAGSGPAEQAAHAFLAGYLTWLYGHGPADAIADATSSLRARLKANPPNVPPAFQSRHGRLVALGLKSAPGGAWTGYASVTDGQETYELTVTVVNQNGRWLVTNVNSPQ